MTSPRAAPVAAPTLCGWVRTDRAVLEDLGSRLDALQDKAGAPLTARRAWLQVWLETQPDHEPLVLGVEDEAGDLCAVTLLATQRSSRVTHVVAMGHRSSDMVTSSAVDERSAARLAELVERHFSALRPWRLLLLNVDPRDPVLLLLAARLPRALLLPGDVSPVLQCDRGPDPKAYVSSSHRRGISRIRNRMVREGHDLEIRHLTELPEILQSLPEVERVHQLRDDHVGRVSAMEEPRQREFFRRVVTRLGERGEVCLTTLRLDGALAAYVLTFLDGRTYRLWNPRFDPAFARLSPGKLAIDEAVAHAVSAGATTYDFMRGEERYKASYANDEVRALELYAGSNIVFALADRAQLSARAWLRRLEESEGRTSQWVPRVREAAKRLRR